MSQASTPSASAPEPAGKRVGGFEIISKIGQGGMGAVFKARQISTDRVVALKVLMPRLAKDQNFVERFLHEARAVAKLAHPNIVQGITVGQADGYYFFAMEYVEGQSVQALLDAAGPLREQKALEITRDIAAALECAHAANVIHRDVKPRNILITGDGTVKLVDLGIVRRTSGGAGQITQPGSALGSPDYISPEQVRADASIDGRSDIYSLGVTLYHMLTGATPYSGGSTSEVMSKHLTEPVPDPRRVNPQISREASIIVRKAMAKKREERYANAAALRKDIEIGLARGSTVASVPAAAPPVADTAPRRSVSAASRRRRRRSLVQTIAGIVVFALAAAAIISVVSLTRNGSRDTAGTGSLPPDDGSSDTAAKDTDLAASAFRANVEARALDKSARLFLRTNPKTLEELRQARAKFAEIVDKYPDTTYARSAKTTIAILGQRIAPLEKKHREEEAAKKEAERQRREAAVKLAAQQRLDAVRKKLPEALRTRKCKELIDELDAMIADTKLVSVKDAAKADCRLLTKFIAVLDRARANARANVGKPARYHGMAATIKRLDGDTVTFSIGKPEAICSMGAMHVKDLLDLSPGPKPAYNEGMALLLIAEGAAADAAPYVANVPDKTDITRLQELVGTTVAARTDTSPPKDPGTGDDDAKAKAQAIRTAFAKTEELFKSYYEKLEQDSKDQKDRWKSEFETESTKILQQIEKREAGVRQAKKDAAWSRADGTVRGEEHAKQRIKRYRKEIEGLTRKRAIMAMKMKKNVLGLAKKLKSTKAAIRLVRNTHERILLKGKLLTSEQMTAAYEAKMKD